MHIRFGKQKLRDYTVEFQNLMNKLPSYDESWIVNIFIWGLQPQLAKSLSTCSPDTATKVIQLAEEIDFSIWASQKDHLAVNYFEKNDKSQKLSEGRKRRSTDNHQRNFDD